MIKQETILERINELYPDEVYLIADGFDDAIIGMSYKSEGGFVLTYSVSKCLNILMNRDGMSYEDAREYFDFNVSGAFVGEKTPIWVEDEDFI
jgi:hypothetical protein